MPCVEPPCRIAPDRAPEQRIIIDVIIVARQYERTDRRDRAVEDQQALVAVPADDTHLERARAEVGGGNERPGILLRSRRAILRPSDRIDAKHILTPPLAAGQALRFGPILENEIRVGRLTEAHPRQDATG